MIRHIVLVRFRADVTDQEKADIYRDLGKLRDHLGGIVDCQFGANISPETAVVHGFNDGFWFDFEDAAARDAYLEDDKHQAAGGRLVEMAEGGLEGITVADFEFQL